MCTLRKKKLDGRHAWFSSTQVITVFLGVLPHICGAVPDELNEHFNFSEYVREYEEEQKTDTERFIVDKEAVNV